MNTICETFSNYFTIYLKLKAIIYKPSLGNNRDIFKPTSTPDISTNPRVLVFLKLCMFRVIRGSFDVHKPNHFMLSVFKGQNPSDMIWLNTVKGHLAVMIYVLKLKESFPTSWSAIVGHHSFA